MSAVVAAGDTITITVSRPMLQIGEGSGVEMIATYQQDGRVLPPATRIRCQTRECTVVGLELPGGTLVRDSTHTLCVANVVTLSGPAIAPDPTTVSFTVAPRP